MPPNVIELFNVAVLRPLPLASTAYVPEDPLGFSSVKVSAVLSIMTSAIASGADDPPEAATLRLFLNDSDSWVRACVHEN